jgi:hypothetical protein
MDSVHPREVEEIRARWINRVDPPGTQDSYDVRRLLRKIWLDEFLLKILEEGYNDLCAALNPTEDLFQGIPEGALEAYLESKKWDPRGRGEDLGRPHQIWSLGETVVYTFPTMSVPEWGNTLKKIALVEGCHEALVLAKVLGFKRELQSEGVTARDRRFNHDCESNPHVRCEVPREGSLHQGLCGHYPR